MTRLLITLSIFLCCNPAQKRAGFDFAVCAAEHVAVPSAKSLAEQLARRGDWQDWGLKALSGTLGASLACGLHSLATMSSANDDRAVEIKTRAARCGPNPGPGQCEDPQDRAAWLLWQASGQAWPPSGKG